MKATAKRIVAIGGVLLTLLGLFSWISARERENAVLKVMPGMHRKEVERLLGAGSPDQSGSAGMVTWPTNREQYSYRANPSLWYGRWEDALIVSYTNDAISNTERCGL